MENTITLTKEKLTELLEAAIIHGYTACGYYEVHSSGEPPIEDELFIKNSIESL